MALMILCQIALLTATSKNILVIEQNSHSIEYNLDIQYFVIHYPKGHYSNYGLSWHIHCSCKADLLIFSNNNGVTLYLDSLVAILPDQIYILSPDANVGRSLYRREVHRQNKTGDTSQEEQERPTQPNLCAIPYSFRYPSGILTSTVKQRNTGHRFKVFKVSTLDMFAL